MVEPQSQCRHLRQHQSQHLEAAPEARDVPHEIDFCETLHKMVPHEFRAAFRAGSFAPLIEGVSLILDYLTS